MIISNNSKLSNIETRMVYLFKRRAYHIILRKNAVIENFKNLIILSRFSEILVYVESLLARFTQKTPIAIKWRWDIVSFYISQTRTLEECLLKILMKDSRLIKSEIRYGWNVDIQNSKMIILKTSSKLRKSINFSMI